LALVHEYGCIAVLKGSGTIVTNGERMYINETGNSGMATGGTGDVLTGVIAALIGQKLDPFEAAILGVYLHGLAGDFAAEELGRRSITALDVIEFLSDALREIELSDASE
jgi:NAD(P)H-hydrate epimerase